MKPERSVRTSPSSLIPSCTWWMHPLSSNSRAVMGFSGEDVNRPWSIQCWMRSRFTGAYVFWNLHNASWYQLQKDEEKDARYVLIHEAVLREPLDDWRLPAFEARLGLAVPRTRLLTLVTATGGLTQTGAATTTKTFLLPTSNSMET